MKCTNDDYQILLTHFQAINKVIFKDHVQFVIDSGKAKDLNKRLRWDCLYSNNISRRMDYFVCDHLYTYMDDTHLDTALKQCMKDSGLDQIVNEVSNEMHS